MSRAVKNKMCTYWSDLVLVDGLEVFPESVIQGTELTPDEAVKAKI